MIDAGIFQQFLISAPKIKALSRKELEQFYEFGFSLYGAGSFQEAVDVFQVLCVQKPLEYKHWFGFAASLQELGQYEKALPAWAMAAALDGTNPYPHFHAAECSFSLGQYREAHLALNEALARSLSYPLLQDQISLLQEQWREYA